MADGTSGRSAASHATRAVAAVRELLLRLAHEPTLGLHYVTLHLRTQLGPAVAAVLRSVRAIAADSEDARTDLDFATAAMKEDFARASEKVLDMSARVDIVLARIREQA